MLPASTPKKPDGAPGDAAAGGHNAVNKASSLVDEAIGQIKPGIARVAATAHGAVDKVAEAAEPAATWINEKARTLRETQQRMSAEAGQYVSDNPLRTVAAAAVTGMLIGRLIL